MTVQALRVLNALRKHAQGVIEKHSDGSTWREVMPMDIHIPGITAQQKPGYLSALETIGFYKKTDKYFGMVRL